MIKMQAFTKFIDENINIIKTTLNLDTTIVYREFENNEVDNVKFCVIYDSSMCKPDIISNDIIRPILNSKKISLKEDTELCKLLVKNILIVSDYKITSEVSKVIDSMLEGDAVLLVENSAEAIILEAKGYSKRSITEPASQKVVRGPREGFTEDVDTNISLLRRRLPDKNFKINLRKLGAISKTDVALCYIDGLVSPKILDEVNKRLNEIDIDGVLESNYIDELISDAPLSLFRTIGITERPDSAAAKLLEGRVIIICSGTPIVLTMPFLFIEHFQESEDYYNHFAVGTINRLLRIVGFVLSISLPAIYLAIMNYHQEMVPTNLAISMSISRSGVPFPTFFELLLYLFIFETIREATSRTPGNVGQTVAIAGALVIGQAAIMAKLVSAPVIIIVSFTLITGFLVLELKSAVIIIRVIFIFFTMILGLYGYIFTLCGLAFYLISLRSFGVPYMLDAYPIKDEDIKDTLIRAPWSFMETRPKIIGQLRMQRKYTQKNKTK
jgi:spore germination protein KA